MENILYLKKMFKKESSYFRVKFHELRDKYQFIHATQLVISTYNRIFKYELLK